MDVNYFTIQEVEDSHVILNIPHSSIFIPSEFLVDYTLSYEDLLHEAKMMGDLYTDELFSRLKQQCSSITLTASRFFFTMPLLTW